MHVFAMGSLDMVCASGSWWRNSMDGCGEKPIGGTVLAPVAKARIVPSFCVPSWSKGKAILSKMALKTKNTASISTFNWFNEKMHCIINWTQCLKR